MFTSNDIAVFHQNLIDNEIEAKRSQHQAELLSVMKSEKISIKKLGEMTRVLHTLMSSTELTLVEILDATSEILPEEERVMDLWEHLKYGAPL